MRWRRSGDQSQAAAKLKRRHALLGAGLATLIMLLLVAWLLIDDSGSGESQSPNSSGTEIVTVDSLRSTAESAAAPIYWAGPREDSELELSQPSPDRAYVRYLTGGAEAGDPRPFLTVGSYRLEDPVGALRGLGRQPDGVLVEGEGGSTVYFSKERPESVYLAYPGTETQIEVYAPDFQEALGLATSGQIVPVD